MHQSVLLNEVLDGLRIREGGRYIDGTIGYGGHAEAILERLGPDGALLGLDRDPDALAASAQRLARWGGIVRLVRADFAHLCSVAEREGFVGADGVLLDLGVSSPQLDEPGRGFSFRREGPLDMRMDPDGDRRAADLVNALPEDELRRLLVEYGEEPRARAIARRIVKERMERPFSTTTELAGAIERAAGGARGRTHPATRSFQALRIAVNDELGALSRGLESGLALLGDGGRMAVISFHSLEDRMVKRCFREHAGRWESLAAGGRRWVGREPMVERVTRKAVVATEAETNRNVRARSARLRVVERVSGR